MRDILLAVAFIIALVVGIWYFLSVSGTRDANANPSSGSTVTAPVPPPAVKKTPANVRRMPKLKGPAEAAPISTPVYVAKPAPPMTPIQTGTVSDVKTGMEASQVVELLGEPRLTALTTEKGSLVETYVYSRKPGDRVWMIRLRGGRVESTPPNRCVRLGQGVSSVSRLSCGSPLQTEKAPCPP